MVPTRNIFWFHLALFSFFYSVSFGQNWSVIHSFNPAQTLHKVRFQNPSFGLTVGSLYNGSTYNIHRTIDGGKTWTDANSGYTAMRFMDIFYLEDSLVYMSGNDGLVLRSFDGGRNWETLNTGVKEQLWGIWFTNRKIGFAVGSNGIIIRTDNGGNDWHVIPSGYSNLFYDVRFNSAGVGIATGSNLILKTIDGGDTWNPVTFFPFEPPADWIRSIHFVNNNLAFACADIGRIYKTMDGGDHWERLESGSQDPLFEIDFIDEKNGLVCGFNGTILETKDGGDTWEAIKSPIGTEHLYSLDYVNYSTAYISSHTGRILKMQRVIGTKDWKFDEISFYPNPVEDHLTIQLNDDHLSYKHQIEVYNSVGTLINHFENNNPTIEFSMGHLPGGTYFVKLMDEQNNIVRYEKIIKQ